MYAVCSWWYCYTELANKCSWQKSCTIVATQQSVELFRAWQLIVHGRRLSHSSNKNETSTETTGVCVCPCYNQGMQIFSWLAFGASVDEARTLNSNALCRSNVSVACATDFEHFGERFSNNAPAYLWLRITEFARRSGGPNLAQQNGIYYS